MMSRDDEDDDDNDDACDCKYDAGGDDGDDDEGAIRFISVPTSTWRIPACTPVASMPVPWLLSWVSPLTTPCMLSGPQREAISICCVDFGVGCEIYLDDAVVL